MGVQEDSDRVRTIARDALARFRLPQFFCWGASGDPARCRAPWQYRIVPLHAATR